MIVFVKGTLECVLNEVVIVDVNGIGYEIRVSKKVLSSISAIGEKIKIYTYMNVREDAINLFGFLTREELEVFKLLITVSGIGPKGALSILSELTLDELRFAILSDDAKTISKKSPGIGIKTANKLILELKDKFNIESDASCCIQDDTILLNRCKNNSELDDAIQALIVLGYSNGEALKAVSKIEIDDNMKSDEIIKKALRML